MDLNQKSDLVNMINSVGWFIASKVAKDKLEEMERYALDCEDESKIPSLVREAKAARKFWDAFLQTIDNAKNPAETPADSFIEVSY